MDLHLLKRLAVPGQTKILLLVLDGLGGIESGSDQPTELQKAHLPHLDELARRSICGLQEPIGPGITPGSGLGHLALFGYDPVQYYAGRGVLAALGIGVDLRPDDVAARGNFCTVNEEGVVTDRRAGRISTEENQKLCRALREIDLGEDVELLLETVKEHRLLLVLRGKDLSAEVGNTDPFETGKKPLPPQAESKQAKKTANLLDRFTTAAAEKLANQKLANMVLLRGLSRRPQWPTLPELFQLRAAAFATYPMYRGVARLVGMEPVDCGKNVEEQFETVRNRWNDYDFFYVHVKPIDSAAEDGDLDRKLRLLEEVDEKLPALLGLKPDVVVVTGDHSTPAALQGHSWHPVPVLLWSEHCRQDPVSRFSERDCLAGSLGPRFRGSDLLPLALGNALRLKKYD